MMNTQNNTVPHRPLSRHPSLRPLSRDHYQGLLQAQRLISVASLRSDRPHALLAEYLEKWESEIAAHFDDEERLLPALIHAQTAREQLFAEHELLRAMTAQLERDLGRGTYDAALVHRLGQLLHDHIRWEERILFEGIQDSAAPEQLENLARETDQVEWTRRKACRNRGIPE